jgi:ribonuclease-3
MTKEEAKKLKELCKNTNLKIKDLELLKIALTHRSFLNEHKHERIEHNERMEFLGDAVLEVLVSEYLYSNYPSRDEGELTGFRAATVRTESLYEEAKRISLGKYIFMSKGEEQTGGRERPYILANTFEAVIGALYLDKGFEATRKFLEKVLFYKIPEIVKNRLDIDNKSKLQELAQEILRETPTYEIVGTTGPDHAKSFTARAIIKEHGFGEGKGASKQSAEQEAAKDALDKWKKLINEYFGID